MINACCNLYFCFIITVHGDIRHLESFKETSYFGNKVHGDIRHLEKKKMTRVVRRVVHGDIRHLETDECSTCIHTSSSWRHTPFRN